MTIPPVPDNLIGKSSVIVKAPTAVLVQQTNPAKALPANKHQTLLIENKTILIQEMISEKSYVLILPILLAN